MSTNKQMSKEEVNQELCERLGIRWHEKVGGGLSNMMPEICLCNNAETYKQAGMHINPDFFSDSGKILLLREMRNSDYWNRFYIWASDYARIMDYNSSGRVFIAVNCLLDEAFVERVLEWLRKEQG